MSDWEQAVRNRAYGLWEQAGRPDDRADEFWDAASKAIQLELLKQGAGIWNNWRTNEPSVEPNLAFASLRKANLGEVNLRGAELFGASFFGANLSGANLSRANLRNANLAHADLSGANLSESTLSVARLLHTNLRGANLRRANLTFTMLAEADLSDADLTGCWVYGTSAWNVKLNDNTRQHDLLIGRDLTVDNIEVAQFIYLVLHNDKIREVIDTIGKKAVLILGRFTPERKMVLNELRGELRKRGYLPVLFDFDVPKTRDVTETVSLLAHMARFIVADLTDPASIPKELEAIVPHLAVPVQPLLEGLERPYSMFKDYWKYDWVLQPYRYNGPDFLRANLAQKVIEPAEAKVKDLEKKRRDVEAALSASLSVSAGR